MIVRGTDYRLGVYPRRTRCLLLVWTPPMRVGHNPNNGAQVGANNKAHWKKCGVYPVNACDW
eukprot:12915679-Prorocentrum_lima.AAC.1